MKKAITTLLLSLLAVATMSAEETMVRDTIIMSKEWSADVQKRVDEAMKKAEESLKHAEEKIRRAEEDMKKRGLGLGDTTTYSFRWDGKHFGLMKGFPGEEEAIDLPKDQKPLIDLSNMKGQSGIEDYYFSGELLHAQARRKGDFYLGGWNIRPLLHRLSGLLILKTKKKASEKTTLSRRTQLRNDKRFKPIVHDKGITIYGHRTKDDLLDEVILLHVPSSSTDSRIVIVQMMGLLRTDDLMSYARLCEPAPVTKKR